ncbi:hypothetical protein EGW08_014356 [Elysia chlorotica]|uniref:GST C-terminal domain-containing protein n=1 Tax=Elysia chlorotica TaxID=188477 RepID=A0A433T8H6_ELYCH|nr:hypothetical protein EGW08_014356 [Elysia chlorotica]
MTYCKTSGNEKDSSRRIDTRRGSQKHVWWWYKSGLEFLRGAVPAPSRSILLECLVIDGAKYGLSLRVHNCGEGSKDRVREAGETQGWSEGDGERGRKRGGGGKKGRGSEIEILLRWVHRVSPGDTLIPVGPHGFFDPQGVAVETKTMEFVEQVKDTVTTWVSDHPYVTSGVVAIATAHILHKLAKSLTPFAVKLETYLRLANIPYQNDYNLKMSSKGKIPWISYNGEAVADSQLAMEFLNAKLGVDLNRGLTEAQKAQAHAFRIMVDEHMYWCLAHFRWVYERYAHCLTLVGPRYVLYFIRRKVIKHMYAQGMGRHSTEEIKQKMLQDLQALSVQLGDKKFFMGDHPTEVDCSVFGMLTWLVFTSHDDVTLDLVKNQFPSLYQYTMRMKDAAWPDWDECNTKGATVKATK